MASRFLVLVVSATGSSQFQRGRGDSQLLVSSKTGFLSTSLTDCVGRRTRKEMARFDGDERME